MSPRPVLVAPDQSTVPDPSHASRSVRASGFEIVHPVPLTVVNSPAASGMMLWASSFETCHAIVGEVAAGAGESAMRYPVVPSSASNTMTTFAVLSAPASQVGRKYSRLFASVWTGIGAVNVSLMGVATAVAP